jgi:MscS family membrane protein
MSRRRILETIHLRAEDLERLPALLAELKTEIAKHPRIDTALPIDVVFNAFNYHALELLIDVYTFETRLDEYRLVKQEILLLAGQLIKAHNLEYAYPIFSQTCP